MKTLLTFVLMLALLLPVSVLAQDKPAEYQFKLDTMTSTSPRYVGDTGVADNKVGTINFAGFNLYIDQLKIGPSHRPGAAADTTYKHLAGIEYRQFFNDIRESSTLVLPETEFNFGLRLSAGRHCSFGVAGTQKTFLGDSPYSSSLFYTKYQRRHGGIEVGLQPSSDGSLTYLVGNHDFDTEHRFYYAMSREVVETGHGHSVKEMTHNRFGGGVRYQLPEPSLHLLFGANYNPTLEKPSWVLGVSRSVGSSETGLRPGLMVVHRIKPSVEYWLGILTFGGNEPRGGALNQYANAGMHSAFYQGLQQSSKVVGGKHMGKVGIGGDHEQRDFGTISLAWSRLRIGITEDITLLQDDFTGYVTYPDWIGPIFQPCLGLTVARFNDLDRDPVSHQMTDPEQDYVEFKLGGKIQLSQQQDDEQGYLRVNLYVRDTGMAGIKTSFWF